MADTDPAGVVRKIIDANLYMVLATADAAGRPWASPVYFANSGYHEFFWVSSPEATHSRNIAVRPQVGIVVFDSQVPIGTGQAVYMEAVAEEVTGAEVERGVEVFSRRSLAHGGVAWTADDVRPEAGLHLYRATAAGHSILAKDGQPDHRVAAQVDPPGR
ncbi:MAG TPA: pyridoxamine 5'-phosphate oxidase family protein [Actinomycetota bacterium]|jgi:Pyridoxamine 5'-phosphate oxidase